MCALIATNFSGEIFPSKRINVGKLNESLPENVLICSDAIEASEPFGKKEELLLSWTVDNLPKSGPKMPDTKNQAMTTNIARANGLRDFVVVIVDTIDIAFRATRYA
jgi:hypothetical protein